MPKILPPTVDGWMDTSQLDNMSNYIDPYAVHIDKKQNKTKQNKKTQRKAIQRPVVSNVVQWQWPFVVKETKPPKAEEPVIFWGILYDPPSFCWCCASLLCCQKRQKNMQERSAFTCHSLLDAETTHSNQLQMMVGFITCLTLHFLPAHLL